MKKFIFLFALIAVIIPATSFGVTLSPSSGSLGEVEQFYELPGDCPGGGAYAPWYASADDSAPWINDSHACSGEDAPDPNPQVFWENVIGAASASDEDVLATIGFDPCDGETCTITSVISTDDCAAVDLTTCLATAISYDTFTWVRNEEGAFPVLATNALLATASETLGDNFSAMISFFIKFGLPVLLLLAVWYFIHRLSRP